MPVQETPHSTSPPYKIKCKPDSSPPFLRSMERIQYTYDCWAMQVLAFPLHRMGSNVVRTNTFGHGEKIKEPALNHKKYV
jgi:hypothetical protein